MFLKINIFIFLCNEKENNNIFIYKELFKLRSHLISILNDNKLQLDRCS